VGEQGHVQGDITAKSVVVAGKVTGNVIASGALSSRPRDRSSGYSVPQISIAEGALFEGSCVMAADKTKVVNIDQVLASAPKNAKL